MLVEFKSSWPHNDYVTSRSDLRSESFLVQAALVFSITSLLHVNLSLRGADGWTYGLNSQYYNREMFSQLSVDRFNSDVWFLIEQMSGSDHEYHEHHERQLTAGLQTIHTPHDTTGMGWAYQVRLAVKRLRDKTNGHLPLYLWRQYSADR